MYTPEENAFIVALRAKCAAGYGNTEEGKKDLARAVEILRQKRMSAVEGAAKKRKAAATSTRTADDLLGELMG